MQMYGDAGGSAVTSATWPNTLSGGRRRGELLALSLPVHVLVSCLTNFRFNLIDVYAEELGIHA